MFFGKLSVNSGPYLDVLSAESLEISHHDLKNFITSDKFSIKQVPSWYFSEVNDESQDLVTATTVLNELNTAAIIHMISQSNRVLKKGGYLYIRDSAKLKPGRHNINYDKVLADFLGYELVHWLDVKNRVDMFAIPRIYKKTKSSNYSFEELFEKLVGREAVTSHGLEYAQNLK
jgi:ubiquinone/menaquinone biosynthesis C-methylase UbiE